MSLTIRSRINGELALCKSIPKLDGLITRSRYNLTIVHRKCYRQNILGVSYKTTSGLSRVDLPKTKSSVPRSRETELSIGGDYNVRDEVVVSTEGAEGVSIGVVFGVVGDGGLTGEVPYHDGFVAGGGEEEVGVFGGGGDGGDPIAVSLEGSAERQGFRHVCFQVLGFGFVLQGR
mmetsp:Transcript_2995/g.5593  ORF Transcript_2995/g.5593 Transcript_2995/m.5593 type:complete len:175 (-) Transcript_2995:106-630(-)